MPKHIGILTSGGDCPGLNAAIRALVRAGEFKDNMQFTGFRDGFRGLAFDHSLPLHGDNLAGILTDGGTILGTCRDKPHKIKVDGKKIDMTDAICKTYARHKLDAVVCIGGGGTQKNALRLLKAGLNVVTLPKTIDNDIAFTDTSIGYDTARGIATESIDRLHSTATSHNRVITVEIMGHRAGWLALESGIAGGADVILLPEIPYDQAKVSAAIHRRTQAGRHFSIVAVAEGAMSTTDAQKINQLVEAKKMPTARRRNAVLPRNLIKYTPVMSITPSSSQQNSKSLPALNRSSVFSGICNAAAPLHHTIASWRRN